MSQQVTVEKLRRIAEETMVENGFQTDFPPQVFDELEALKTTPSVDSNIKDLRQLLWSSIDNDTSKDLDQIEYAEEMPNGDIRLLVAIADVDEYVKKGSAIDDFAVNQTVSVYTDAETFAMLPKELSENLTSLLPKVDRYAVVIEMIVNENGEVPTHSIYQALTRNYAKLTYESVGDWLDNNGTEPAEIAEISGLKEQIFLQKRAAERLLSFRQKRGSLEFETIESVPVFAGDQVKDLEFVKTNSARRIIENFMVAANVEMSEFLDFKGLTSIRRVVKTPARWERIREIAEKYGESLPVEPDSNSLAEFLKKRKAAAHEQFADLSLSIIKLIGAGEYVSQNPRQKPYGHFGLAVRDYTHSTAPNRRLPDLITQRLVKAVLKGDNPPYSDEQLGQIAEHCNERESAARKVERKMRKVIAAGVMQSRIGQTFEAIVTGVTPSGTFARILRPPVDGRIVRGDEGLQVGENITVRLLATNINNGFIDFAYIKGA